MKVLHNRSLQIVFLVATLFVSVRQAQAQSSQKSPQDILREAQERQRAIDKAGENLRKNLNDIYEREQRRREQEREDRRRQEEADRADSETERQRRQKQKTQEDLKRSIQQVQDNQRQQQETTERVLQNGRKNSPDSGAAALPKSSSKFETRPSNSTTSSQGSSERSQTPSGLQRSDSHEMQGNPLAGTPNDQSPPSKGWTAWKHVSDNIWVSYVKVQEKFENGQPLWTWSLKNWNDRTVKTIWFEYYSKGSWHKDLEPTLLKPRAGHGGWGTFTAVSDDPPPIRIVKVDFK